MRFSGSRLKADRRYFPFRDTDKVNYRVHDTKFLSEFLENEKCQCVDEWYNQNAAITPLTNPVTFNYAAGKRIPIDPYALGLLLGDGCLRGHDKNKNHIGYSTADQFLINELRLRTGVDFVQSGASHNFYSRGAGEFVLLLKALGVYDLLSHEKFIPNSYLMACVEDRWEIVRGLMDTDGYVDSSGRCQFTTVSRDLAAGVDFLLRSLGFMVTTTRKRAGYRDSNGEGS